MSQVRSRLRLKFNTSRQAVIIIISRLTIATARLARSAYFALISKAIWTNEALVFEPRLRGVYRSLSSSINRGNPITILDIGANRGQAARLLESCFPGARIIAVEANPDLIPLLRNKTRDLNIEVLPFAVSERPGILPFYKCIFDEVSTFEQPNNNSKYLQFKSKVLMVSPDKMYERIDVSTTTLDHIAEDLGLQSIDILKIDVEGHELSVLKGGERMLASKLPRCIQIETHSDDQYQDKGEHVQAILLGHGYQLIIRIKHGFGNFYEEIYGAF